MSRQEDLIVRKPPHYQQGTIETRFLIAHCTIGLKGIQAYYLGNIIKYVQRAPFKNGYEDINKALTYLDFLYATTVKGQRMVEPMEMAMQHGGDETMWSKVYEIYEDPTQIKHAKGATDSLYKLLLSVGNKEELYIMTEASLIKLEECLYMRDHGTD